MSGLLLVIAVLSWGFSWYAITLQVAHAPALVSIAYRFILAAGLLIGFLALTGRLKAIPLRDHRWVLAMGVCLFSMNFYCYYLAAHYLPSGILSVIFATAAIVGAINQRIILGVPLDRRVMLAAAIGVTGLALLLGPELRLGSSEGAWKGVVLSFCGTFLFSLGNLVSSRLGARYALPNLVGQGMAYGALIAFFLGLISGQSFALPQAHAFWAALVFLALISTVVAFLAYLNLVKREGPVRASYATVLFPIVAMCVSSWLEGYEWTLVSTIGLGLALGGTVIVFSRRAH